MKNFRKAFSCIFLLLLLIPSFAPIATSQDTPKQGNIPFQPNGIERNLHTTTYHYSNGTSKTTLFNDFVNYFNGTNFVDINTTLVESDDEDYQWMVEGVYDLYFKEDPKSSPAVKYWYDSMHKNQTPSKSGYMTFDLQGLYYRQTEPWFDESLIEVTQSVVGSPQENKLIYSNVFGSELDIIYSYKASTLKELFIINKNTSLPSPPDWLIGEVTLDLDCFIFVSDSINIYVAGKLWQGLEVGTHERIDFKIENETVFALNSARAFDANKSSISSEYVLKTKTIKGKERIMLTIRTPYDWLNKGAPKIVGRTYNKTSAEYYWNSTIVWNKLDYPVTIDPTITTLRPTGDSTPKEMPYWLPATDYVEYCYVDDRINDIDGWEHIGTEPWLGANNDEIKTDVDNSVEGEFTFENATSHPTLDSVYLWVTWRQEGSGETVDIDVYDGSSWSNLVSGASPPSGAGFGQNGYDASTILNSWAKINVSRAKFTYHKSGKADYVHIKICRLKVDSHDPDPDHYTFVDEEVADDEDVVGTWGEGQETETPLQECIDMFSYPNFDLPEGNQVDWVRIYCRMGSELSNPTYRPKGKTVLIIDTEWSYGVEHKLEDMATYHTEYTENPATNSSWTENDVNNAKFGVWGKSAYYTPLDIYVRMFCSQVYVEVQYSSAQHNVTFYFYSGGTLLVNGTNTENGTSTEYSPDTILNITGVPNYQYLFRSHTYDGSNTTDNPFYLTVTQDYTTHTYFREIFDCDYIGINSTRAGQPVKFSSNWTDLYNAEGLSHNRFSTNNTGSWLNDTWSDSWENTVWAVSTKTLNSTAGLTIAFRFYVNDTSGNEYASTIAFFLTLAISPPSSETSMTVYLVVGLGFGFFIALALILAVRNREEEKQNLNVMPNI